MCLVPQYFVRSRTVSRDFKPLVYSLEVQFISKKELQMWSLIQIRRSLLSSVGNDNRIVLFFAKTIIVFREKKLQTITVFLNNYAIIAKK